jgi:hypothetical protein
MQSEIEDLQPGGALLLLANVGDVGDVADVATTFVPKSPLI